MFSLLVPIFLPLLWTLNGHYCSVLLQKKYYFAVLTMLHMENGREMDDEWAFLKMKAL